MKLLMVEVVPEKQSTNVKNGLDIFVMIKQVPVPKAMKTTKEGLMDRSGKSIMNPHCAHALEEALTLRDKVGGTITVVSMGPPNAQQSLKEALRKGADQAYLLSDRKLAGSDTWATAEALSTLINYILKKEGKNLDILFAGLQTIDGDTAHVGPQVAARLQLNQASYVENIKISGNKHLEIRRVIEKGYQILKIPFPMMLSITSSANAPRGPSLNYSITALNKEVHIYDIEMIGLSEDNAGLPGSPTVVSRVKNVVIDREEVVLFNEGSMENKVENMLNSLLKKKEGE